MKAKVMKLEKKTKEENVGAKTFWPYEKYKQAKEKKKHYPPRKQIIKKNK